jgi:tRNA nucleotidyltransferase/poly(A) polymerase
MMATTVDWAEILDALADLLTEAGSAGWLVGGCLRDALLGVAIVDVDIACDSDPLAIAETVAQRLALSLARLGHGTIRLAPRAAPDGSLDLTPLTGADIANDLARRDFTLNALALPMAERAQWLACIGGQTRPMPGLVDPFGGRDDLAARRLVAVSPETFRQDPGRIVRAARLCARFGLQPDSQTLELAREAVPLLATLSADRLRDELNLLLALPTVTDGVALLANVGALSVFFPGLSGDAAAAVAALRRLDALLASDPAHDYPAMRAWGGPSARRIALRRTLLASPQGTTLRQQAAAELAIDDAQDRDRAARLLFAQVGRDEAAAVDALVLAAITGDGADIASRAQALVDRYLRDHDALIPPPLLTGGDLISELALAGGPEIGRLLQAVRRAQLADEVRTRAEALELARRLL